jgi:hypothetical protein
VSGCIACRSWPLAYASRRSGPNFESLSCWGARIGARRFRAGVWGLPCRRQLKTEQCAARRQLVRFQLPLTPRGGGVPAASPGNNCPGAASGSLGRAPGPGIQFPLPVTITGIGPVAAPLAVTGAADRISLRGHQRLRERLHRLPEQIRARPGQLLVQHPDISTLEAIAWLLISILGRFSEDHAVAVSPHDATPVS